MAFNLTQTLINSRLVTGNPKPGNEIALRIDPGVTDDFFSSTAWLRTPSLL